MNERRTYSRRRLWFPVTLELPSGLVWGISRDVSSGGLMISTSEELDVGAPVEMVFRLHPKGSDRRASARILRCWRNDDELHLAFPYRSAIQFDVALADLESE